MDALKIIKTADGSDTIYNERLDETYHSHRGAFSESQRVFIDCGLAHWALANEGVPVNLLEVGLGSGLNAALSAEWAGRNKRRLAYDALEPFPLATELTARLNYFDGRPARQKQLKAIHDAAWNVPVDLDEHFTLKKIRTMVQEFKPDKKYDIIFFDAFAPSKQPEMWARETLQKMYEALSTGGVLTTYCAQGAFKRNLVSLSFRVESLPGPAGGKREMVRATK